MPPRSPHDEPGPPAPAIPSFASLRSPSRRSAVDLLVGPPDRPAPAPEAPAPAPPRPAPRPAEYGDLLRFGVRVARAALGVPGCVLARLRGAARG